MPNYEYYDKETITVPDGIEPILAWREWRHSGAGLLFPLSGSGKPWTPRRALEASCTQRSHVDLRETQEERYIRELEAQVKGETLTDADHAHARTFENTSPVGGCSCGIYAKRHPIESTTNVVGQVKLWGKIRRGNTGYKAQYAYPASIYIIMANGTTGLECEPYRRMAQRIGRLYQVDTTALVVDDYLDKINLVLVEHYATTPTVVEDDEPELEDDDF